MIVNELLTWWGFDVDDKKVKDLDKQLAKTKANAEKAGDQVADAFARPRDAQGKFTKYKADSIFAGGNKILGGYHESLTAIKESANSARNAILAMGAAFAVGSAGLAGVFNIMGSMEQTEIAFETMIGDAEKAKKTLADLQNFAKTTPFNFADTADLSKRLLAFSFQAEELIPIMTSLGNIAAGVGKEKLPQLVLALGQVKAAGKLRGSELRQFTEAGVPLIAELAKSLGIADSKVQDLVESGKVGFDDVWKALQKVTGEGGRFNNLMARQSTSLLGMFSNLVDTLQLMLVDLGKRGLLGKAKEYLTSFLAILETNREQILAATQHAVELVVEGLGKLVNIARNVWQVFRGLTQVVGGVRKAMDLFIKGMVYLTSARLLFLLGKFAIGVAGLARTWIMAGNAAMWAQLKMAAIPIAIGAAIVALGLIIEDVVAYFQGRKSITGMILQDLDGLGERFEKFLAPIFEKVKNFASSVGKSIVDGISALSSADWKKFADVLGDGMMSALEVILIASTIPLRIGMAIASGLLEGLIAGIRERFPKLSAFLGLTNEEKVSPEGFKTNTGVLPGIMDVLKMVAGASQLRNYNPIGGMSVDNLKLPQPRTPGNPNNVQVDAPVTVNVPPGTPPEQVGSQVKQGVKKAFEGMVNEAARASRPQVDY